MDFQINWPYIAIVQGYRIFFTHSCCIDEWTKIWYHQSTYKYIRIYLYMLRRLGSIICKSRIVKEQSQDSKITIQVKRQLGYFGLTGCQVIAPTLWQATWRSGLHVETETNHFSSCFYPKNLGDSDCSAWMQTMQASESPLSGSQIPQKDPSKRVQQAHWGSSVLCFFCGFTPLMNPEMQRPTTWELVHPAPRRCWSM